MRFMKIAAAFIFAASLGGTVTTELEAKKFCAKKSVIVRVRGLSAKHGKVVARRAWRTRVATRYSGKWSKWAFAKKRKTSCKKFRGKYFCTAAARPCRLVFRRK